MATIRVRCGACGERSDLQPAQIELEVEFDEYEEPRSGRYAFDCPSCGAHIQVEADGQAVGLLMAGGVTSEVAGVSGAGDGRPLPPHPEQPPGGPPFTPDDLLELHLMLQQDGWFDRLRSTSGGDR